MKMEIQKMIFPKLNDQFMTYMKILWMITWVFIGQSSVVQGQDQIPRPNFIFILADDMGWTSTSVAMDGKSPETRSDFYLTPHLEALAKQGMVFSRGYASAAICSPSRRSIQFGQSPARLGDESFKDRYHPDLSNRPTIPRILKAVDSRYVAAHYGKWDLRADIFPEDLGYDESDGDTGNSHGNMNSNSISKWTEYYLTDDPKRIRTLTDRALNFIKRQTVAERPFFLQVSHYATHVDIQAREKTLEKHWKRDPGEVHDNPGFAAMTEDLDSGIGRILDRVRELGIEGHTYIIFMSDNGGVELIPQTKAKMIPPSEYGHKRRNYPLRGGKWTLYEGGIRVPFIVAGPGIEGGSVSDFPIVGWDIMPTVSTLAGYEGDLSEESDGVSMDAAWRNIEKAEVDAYRPLYFHRYHGSYGHSAVIRGQYKLVKHWKSGKMELFNLWEDLGETRDLSQDQSQLATEMYDLLVSYLRRVDSEIIRLYDP